MSSGGMGSMFPDVTGGGSYFVGGSVQLSATLDYVTSRTVTYQWQRGGSPDIGNDWVDIDVATGPVLEISPLSLSDADLYRVQIEIGGCSAVGWSFPVEVSVLAPPSFSGPSVPPETGTLTFVLNAEATFDYAIEYSSDLEDWELLRTVLNPAGPVEITDSEVPEVQRRFYRARVFMAP